MNVKAELVQALETVAGRREPRGARRAHTWNHIVEVATRMFVHKGVSGVSMEEIAAAAEVSRATLYNYVPSKEHLLLAAFAEETLANLHRLAPSFDENRPARERLHETVKAGLMISESLPLTTRLLAKERSVLMGLASHPTLAAVMAQFPGADKGAYLSALVSEAFAGTFDDDERSQVVAMLRSLGPLGASWEEPEARHGETLEVLADQMTRTLLDGLERRADKQTPSRNRA